MFAFSVMEMASFSIIHSVWNPPPWIDFFPFWTSFDQLACKAPCHQCESNTPRNSFPNWIFSFEETEGEFNTALKLRWRKLMCVASCTRVVYIQFCLFEVYVLKLNWDFVWEGGGGGVNVEEVVRIDWLREECWDNICCDWRKPQVINDVW